MPNIPPYTTVAALAERYEVFLLDQFGVLHNGAEPYPYVMETLQQLRDAQRRLVLLSNSSRRVLENTPRMQKLGFQPEWFEAIVTSGEVFASYLAHAPEKLGIAGERLCYAISHYNLEDALQGTRLKPCAQAEEAEVILAVGGDLSPEKIAKHMQDLRPLAARKVPMICLNPDQWGFSNGGFHACPGQLADAYQAAGGDVCLTGKPSELIYEFTCSKLSFAPKQAVAVGDSLKHDIAGAQKFGCASALVRTGIFAALPDADLSQKMAEEQARPDFLLKEFAW